MGVLAITYTDGTTAEAVDPCTDVELTLDKSSGILVARWSDDDGTTWSYSTVGNTNDGQPKAMASIDGSNLNAAE